MQARHQTFGHGKGPQAGAIKAGMIDRIHMRGIRSGKGHLLHAVNAHEDGGAIIHLGIDRIEGNDLRSVGLDDLLHAGKTERVARQR